MMPDELKNRERSYKAKWRAYSIVKRMRWVTLILGPIPLLWDNVIGPMLESFGVPDIVTMEDLSQALLFEVLPLEKWVSRETFEAIWPHLNNVCTVLFLVFVFWTIQKRRAAKAAAQSVVELEGRMSIGGFGGVR
ncbi:MAG: hypothetical protein VX473_00040 [Candidatus Thermoplasmatota archaeon]|jgi:hypothetical protein|nr:hypothetical protein [Candidatus Thermoplasmatota archaeon]